ncbi:MAG: hypothetical protein V3R64_10485, partial [Sphingomonadales bacterium]
PYNSPYGIHLVLVTKNVPGRTPDLEEVFERVRADAIREAINEILKTYEVKIDLLPPDPSKLAETAE